MIHEIDFLPATYHIDRVRRHRTRWRIVAMIAAVGLIIAGSVRQHQINAALKKQRDDFRATAQRMVEPLAEVPKLKDQTKQLDEAANLFTYIRLRVPTSRLLGVLTESLPSGVSLNEFTLRTEQLPKVQVATSGRGATIATEKKEKRVGVVADLEQLQKHDTDTAQFATVIGVDLPLVGEDLANSSITNDPKFVLTDTMGFSPFTSGMA